MTCRWYRWIFVFITFIMNLHICIGKKEVKRRIVIWKYPYWSKMFVRSGFLLVKIGFKSRHDRNDMDRCNIWHLMKYFLVCAYVRLKWRKSKATELTKNKLYLSCSFSFFSASSSLVLIYFSTKRIWPNRCILCLRKKRKKKEIDEIYIYRFSFSIKKKRSSLIIIDHIIS